MPRPSSKFPQNNFFFKPANNLGLTNQVRSLFQQGLMLLNNKKPNEAKEIFEKIIKIDSIHVDSINLLGIISVQSKDLKTALNYFNKAIKLNNNNIFYYCNRGNVYIELGEFGKATINFNKAIELDPNYADAYCYKGIALANQNLWEEAEINLTKSIAINSINSEAYLNLGNILGELKRYEDAINNYKKAILIDPDFAMAYSNYGKILRKMNRLVESLELYDSAIKIKSDLAEAHFNRGNLLEELQRYDEAITSYDEAITINPYYAQAYWNKSITLLAMGEFAKGWHYYEWRWKNTELNLREFQTTKPKLQSIQAISEKKILLHNEQGVGDQVLYTSLLQQLTNLAPFTKVLLDQRLIPLLRRSMPQVNFIENNLPVKNVEYDEHLPIADLGKYFRKSKIDFQDTQTAYLKADQHKSFELRNKLLNNSKLLCGVAWKSKTENIGYEKSIDLELLLPIFKMQNISFVNLQYGDVKNEIKQFNRSNGLNIQICNEIDNFNDLDGHASLIHACDFVVTISNTTAHISGALGKETYLMCSKGKGQLWYWSNEVNGKSMWYPSIEIYSQKITGQWTEVIDEIKKIIEIKLYEIQ